MIIMLRSRIIFDITTYLALPLNELFLLIDALIESRQQLPQAADKQTDKLSDSNNGKRIAGHIEIKQIPTGKNKTKPYRYLRYWQNGKLKSTYLGKVE